MNKITEFDKFWMALSLVTFLIIASPTLIRMWIADLCEMRKCQEKRICEFQKAIDNPDRVKL
jgi:hypothetical protein